MGPVPRSDPSDAEAPQTGRWSGGLSRRRFLRNGSFTAATVAAIGTVPGLSGLIAGSASDAPAVDEGLSDVEENSGALSEPLVAHVKDIQTGEMSLFQGEREISLRSPSLARSLMSAARSQSR